MFNNTQSLHDRGLSPVIPATPALTCVHLLNGGAGTELDSTGATWMFDSSVGK